MIGDVDFIETYTLAHVTEPLYEADKRKRLESRARRAERVKAKREEGGKSRTGRIYEKVDITLCRFAEHQAGTLEEVC